MRTELKGATSGACSATSSPQVVDTVAAIIDDVRRHGDEAVRRHSQKFDGWSPGSFRLSEAEVTDIVKTVPTTTMDDLRFAQRQIAGFAQAQRETLLDLEVETLPGVFLGHRHVPVAAAAAYVPGGRYPLTASAHMTVLTAKVVASSGSRRPRHPSSGSRRS